MKMLSPPPHVNSPTPGARATSAGAGSIGAAGIGQKKGPVHPEPRVRSSLKAAELLGA